MRMKGNVAGNVMTSFGTATRKHRVRNLERRGSTHHIPARLLDRREKATQISSEQRWEGKEKNTGMQQTTKNNVIRIIFDTWVCASRLFQRKGLVWHAPNSGTLYLVVPAHSSPHHLRVKMIRPESSALEPCPAFLIPSGQHSRHWASPIKT